MAALRSRVVAGGLAAATVLGTACGDKTGDPAAFCAALQANAQAIMNPQLATDADIEAHVAIYRDLAEDAPLAVEEDWGTILEALETASGVDPGDAEATELARRAIYSAQESAGTVRTWVTTNCGFDLATFGPIGTIAVPTTTTIIVAPTTAG